MTFQDNPEYHEKFRAINQSKEPENLKWWRKRHLMAEMHLKYPGDGDRGKASYYLGKMDAYSDIIQTYEKAHKAMLEEAPKLVLE